MAFRPDNAHIIVNYHYVDDSRQDRLGFHPCSVHEFEKQVAFLSGEYTIATVEDVFRAAQENSRERVCALTFDDGLKDNFKNALPILKRHGVHATFFPITKTLEGFLPTTHKMHFLLSLKSSEEIADYYNTFLSGAFPHMVEAFSIPKTERLSRTRKLYDDVITANVKERMNRIPPIIRETFLKTFFQELTLEEEAMASALFMDIKDLKELKSAGHIIGGHGHSHEALDALEGEAIREEVSISRKILQDALGDSVTIFAYPQSAPSVSVHHVLEEGGFLYALTTERREVRQGDDPYLIPRFDTNDIRDFLRAQH